MATPLQMLQAKLAAARAAKASNTNTATSATTAPAQKSSVGGAATSALSALLAAKRAREAAAPAHTASATAPNINTKLQASLDAIPAAATVVHRPSAERSEAPASAAQPGNQLEASTTTTTTVLSAPVLNEQQALAVEYAAKGEAFCLIGSAGTGKTFTECKIVETIAENLRKELDIPEDKFKPYDYIIVCAFTRRAVRNTYKALRSLGDMYTSCCKTVHKALDYKPVDVEIFDAEAMEWRDSMRYMPHVTKDKPNTDVRIIIVDEASMLGYSMLYRQLREGFPKATFVFIGDLNQLRPVMDDPTLAYALASLPVVELSHVYRQALDSPIIDFQYKFTLAGQTPKANDLSHYNEQGKGLKFHALNWGKLTDTSKYCRMFVNQIIAPSIEAGTYNPEDCIILIPYNKHGTFGATDLNVEIAELLGKRREAVVHEVISGFNKFYYAVGDRVLCDKKECEIVEININARYSGLIFQTASADLNRFGYYRSQSKGVVNDLYEAAPDRDLTIDEILATNMESEEDGATQQASHHITVRDCETDVIYNLTTNKEVRELEFSYALTIHKSQGSEWRKVYLIAHACHRNLSREMLYTGMTRAREELVVLYSKGMSSGNSLAASSLARAIERQEIPGKTWKEKAQAYKMKLTNGDADAVIDMDDFPVIPVDENFRVCKSQ